MQPPLTVAYCHCQDCRRATGAPVAAFAAFAEGDVTFEPDEGRKAAVASGATRTFCAGCGSPLTGRFGYLPGQVYVPIGLLDQAGDLAPQVHGHEAQRLPWLHIEDDLERFSASSRSRLRDPASDGSR